MWVSFFAACTSFKILHIQPGWYAVYHHSHITPNTAISLWLFYSNFWLIFSVSKNDHTCFSGNQLFLPIIVSLSKLHQVKLMSNFCSITSYNSHLLYLVQPLLHPWLGQLTLVAPSERGTPARHPSATFWPQMLTQFDSYNRSMHLSQLQCPSTSIK